MKKEKFKQLIGKQIIFFRIRRGWSQSDLARACSKDRQAIEKIEKGRVNPTAYTLFEIASSLEISLSELLNFKLNE